jgi:hypothetical protein
MRSILKILSLTLALNLGAVASIGAPTALAKQAAAKVDRKKAAEHFLKHQTYPATKADLMAACKNLMDFTDGEKEWFGAHLPDRTFNSADEVMGVLFNK